MENEAIRKIREKTLSIITSASSAKEYRSENFLKEICEEILSLSNSILIILEQALKDGE
jgi:hypothetical protein